MKEKAILEKKKRTEVKRFHEKEGSKIRAEASCKGKKKNGGPNGSKKGRNDRRGGKCKGCHLGRFAAEVVLGERRKKKETGGGRRRGLRARLPHQRESQDEVVGAADRPAGGQG